MRSTFQRSRLLAAVCGGVCLVAACGGNPTSQGKEESLTDHDQPTIASPTVVAVSPAIWRAGDTIGVVGTRFMPASQGSSRVRFGGQFKSASGVTSDVDLEVNGTYHAANKLTFVFEPDQNFGDEPGTFSGKVKVTNVSNSGEEAEAVPTDVSVNVAASILVKRLEPVSQSCAGSRVSDTLNGNQLDMELAVSGAMTPPVAFDVTWVDATGEVREQQAASSDGSDTTITVDPGTVPPTDEHGDAATTLYTPVSFSITASDTNGHTLQRRVSVNVREDYEVVYDGNSHIVKLFDPVPVTQCLPGGQTGTSFNYSEGTSENKSRTYSVSGSFKVSVWILSLGFGFGVDSTVSSGVSSGLTASHSVFPHWYGAFYRQTAQLEKTGQIYRYDSCGTRTHIGSAYVTDWTWAPGFNQERTDCPPLPPPLMASDGSLAE
jgi:hypothetical protein